MIASRGNVYDRIPMAEVLALRESGLTWKQVADQFGVTERTVQLIAEGRTEWAPRHQPDRDRSRPRPATGPGAVTAQVPVVVHQVADPTEAVAEVMGEVLTTFAEIGSAIGALRTLTPPKAPTEKDHVERGLFGATSGRIGIGRLGDSSAPTGDVHPPAAFRRTVT